MDIKEDLSRILTWMDHSENEDETYGYDKLCEFINKHPDGISFIVNYLKENKICCYTHNEVLRACSDEARSSDFQYLGDYCRQIINSEDAVIRYGAVQCLSVIRYPGGKALLEEALLKESSRWGKLSVQQALDHMIYPK